MAEAARTSIDPDEVALFSSVADQWWDPHGKFAPLHRFNPIRLAFIREQALARFGRDPKAGQPFKGLRLLETGEPRFDMVLNMEVIEHVAEPGAYLADCSRLLAPGGVMIVATLNRTVRSLALAKVMAEYVLGWLPKGAHDWSKFLTPDELIAMAQGPGLAVDGPFGVSYDPIGDRWSRSEDCAINYMIVVKREAE